MSKVDDTVAETSAQVQAATSPTMSKVDGAATDPPVVEKITEGPKKEKRAVVFKPPTTVVPNGRIVFLAGSIEQGRAEPWQQRLTEDLEDLPITILNPRRDDWDPTWEQRKTNPKFLEQVQWELDGQDMAHVIAMYFDETTMSPITLLELGLYARSKKLIVCCPGGYERKGNVEIVCDRLKIEQVETYEELLVKLRAKLDPSEPSEKEANSKAVPSTDNISPPIDGTIPSEDHPTPPIDDTIPAVENTISSGVDSITSVNETA